MRMKWHDLLFAHWALDEEHVRAALPVPLRPHLHTHEGKAFVGVVPFWMSGVRFHFTPPWPSFAECNVRTYITIDGRPGVYFFSLDCESLPAVWAARGSFNLRYYFASMTHRLAADHHVHYFTRRASAQPLPSALPKGERATLECEFWPTSSAPAEPVVGSLEHFLTERYCLYTAHANGDIWRAEIHHPPWPLQKASAEFRQNSLALSHGIELPAAPPLLHFVKFQDVRVWWPERVL